MKKTTVWKVWNSAPNYFLFTRCERVRRETVDLFEVPMTFAVRSYRSWPKVLLMVFVFGSFAASLGGKNRFRLCHKRSTHWVPAILLAALAVSTCVHPTCVQMQGTLSFPPHPRPGAYSIQHVCKCKGRYHPPPTPDQLCSIQHVCKCKERYPYPPTPDQLRSIQHVCKCKERYHPPPPQTSCVASNMCASARNEVQTLYVKIIQNILTVYSV